MAVRSDISVDFSASPRIVTVAAPSTEINLQDLYDTLRDIEATAQGILYPALLNAAGKQVLGGGALVGMTLTQRNALLAFEARTGPGWVLCSVSGGNLVAIDAGGAPLPSPLQPTAYTFAVVTQSTSASLLSGTGGLTKADVNAAVWVESPIGEQVAVDADFAAQAAIAAAEAATEAATQATLARKARTNRDELNEAATGNYVLYDDDDVTPLRTHTVTDKNGGPITIPAGAPARRSKAI
jgi:hypothetical protein